MPRVDRGDGIKPYLSPVAIDIETTGLDPHDDFILEFAMVICTPSMEYVARVSPGGIRVPMDKARARMSDYVLNMHTENGLLKEVGKSVITLVDVERAACRMLDEVGLHAADSPADRHAIILGNSCRLDLNFIEAQMPQLARHLHYRMLDMSGVGHFLTYASPALALQSERFIEHQRGNRVSRPHCAIDDALDSIAQARGYISAISAATEGKEQ